MIDPLIALAVSIAALFLAIYTAVLLKVHRATDILLKKIDKLETELKMRMNGNGK